jgi:NAD(P)-dependent dehydrogenase (short-subunit alcohol dehydrogenase family)
MSEDFTGKVALVTGAAGGMGRATAHAFAAAGAKVVAADVAVEEGEQTAKLIRVNGGEAVFVRTDKSDASGRSSGRYGGERVRGPRLRRQHGCYRDGDDAVGRLCGGDVRPIGSR